MIVVNFAHPLTAAQREQLQQITGRQIAGLRDVPFQLDNARPFPEQVATRVDAAGLTSQQWQTEPILVNPPGYAPATATLIAELHGRMGHFPSLIRLRPLPDSNPPQFEVAEVINLHHVRETARTRR